MVGESRNSVHWLVRCVNGVYIYFVKRIVVTVYTL